ncbi:LacI family DNA-binding transcriptional regulator [Microbacterium sp. VKM Ac-2923]|uniref:LacI family DNA-binding transcriptional regulator n=1 Tax=Microbacterium sp. VKM Ac-2923 TaxID=2929476 RepID=UPI001FB514E5|nr:LacI family DNA-binding transcriptional regulator [Microbacterium sp. VKM Ac-2923]MCJ1707874.1 LacI family transcriptional regulator [Microbacterium sp. VKM Ac-2923]
MRKTGRPTMIDVAADAGVSLKTVSRVINGEPNVDPGMAERVVASVQRLGYHRNALAASLRSGSRDTIGFIAADLSNTFYVAVAAAVSAVAARDRLHLVMASSEEDADTERSLALDLCQRQVGGLIVVPTADDHSYLAREVELGTPVVFLDRPGSGIPADAILLDNSGGARAAVAELLAAGHRRIAILLDRRSIYTMSQRWAGVEEAFAAAGRTPDPALVIDGLHTPAMARDAMERLLDADDAPTAVFCANNRVTIGALEAILLRGAEVAVAGFDDFELSRLLPRRIRIVDYDVADLGTRAAEILLARAVVPATGSQTHLVPTRLVSRGGIR